MKRVILILAAAVLLSGCPPQNPSGHSATVKWQAGGVYPPTVQYRIYRGANCASLILGSTVSQSVTSVTDSTVISGQSYCYQVSAFNSANGLETKAAPVTVTIP